ncbi:MAG: hypothetical protein WCD70_12950 [Alphaproteobacteria bacterium]
MVQEVRRIILSKPELLSALESHRRMSPDILPDGKIVDFEIIDSTSMRVNVETDPTKQESSVVFSGDKLIFALIRYCIENNIILPVKGRKSVLIAEGTVSLCISLDLHAPGAEEILTLSTVSA